MIDHAAINMDERKEDMFWWASRMLDVHFKTTAILLALAVGTVGFIASHMLSSEYGHDSLLEVVLMLSSGLLLLVSCANGLFGFVKLLEFCSNQANLYAEYFRLATALRYEKYGASPVNPNRTKEPSAETKFTCLVFQRLFFALGMLFLIAWVLVAYFCGANPNGILTSDTA